MQMWHGVSPVPVQMWHGVRPVPVQTWHGVSPVPVQMWHGMTTCLKYCRKLATMFARETVNLSADACVQHA